jgi:signal transduction histidine kinase
LNDSESRLITGLLSTWTGVLISLLMLASLIFIKRIFNIQERMEELRRQSESRILSAIVRTEEKERLHFSKELHDGLGPLLASVKMAISAGRRSDANAAAILLNAENLIDESVATLKEISNKLSPDILNSFGLQKAVKSFLAKLAVNELPILHFNTNIGNKRFNYNVEVVAYRVICELIANSLSHARAKNVYITLTGLSDCLQLEYLDDGRGFNMQQLASDNTGLGFANMQSRVRSLKGSIELYSEENEGLSVNITIPLLPETDKN